MTSADGSRGLIGSRRTRRIAPWMYCRKRRRRDGALGLDRRPRHSEQHYNCSRVDQYATTKYEIRSTSFINVSAPRPLVGNHSAQRSTGAGKEPRLTKVARSFHGKYPRRVAIGG
jgi:hypothetical protein